MAALTNTDTSRPSDWLAQIAPAAAAARAYGSDAVRILAEALARDGKVSTETANQEQRRLHGLAWIATTVAAISQTERWALVDRRQLSQIDELAIRVGFGEYFAALTSGIVMSQNEIVRPGEMGLAGAAASLARNEAVSFFLDNGSTAETRARLTQLLLDGQRPTEALDDDLDMIRDQFRSFAGDKITPHAQAWHLADTLIPIEIVDQMAELGVFSICVSPDYGGLGMSKLAMCVVTEELSYGWIAAGSLGTRAEIACELIANAGTEEQKSRWLPAIASGEVLPTAVFTEPDTGSDLAHIKTRGSRRPDGSWRIDGGKTWITHASRSDLMTLLARTDPSKPGHDGLSMFLAEKARGTEVDPFPTKGMSGGTIDVLGYRGMREYDLSFDDFTVAANGVLGGQEGLGFRQLMQTFEAARIQTAARAIGVGRRALDLGLAYAAERRQFGSSIANFPRVSDKLAVMAAELLMARELTYFAAREKDEGRRCDVEAGMAKLLGARVAWTNADNALQIHGGNGYALEYEISRVFCDARILNIFEGAAEIQAHVIGRGLLAGGRN